jgi:RINT-1 / TIP-1 family
MPVDYAAASPEHRTIFEHAFRLLLDFQLMYVLRQFLGSHLVHFPSGEKLHPDDDELVRKDGLFPIHVLVQPLSQRFKYHFEGTRKTNKLDKVALLYLRSSYFLTMFSPSGTSRTSSTSLMSIDYFSTLSYNASSYLPNTTMSMHGYDFYETTLLLY